MRGKAISIAPSPATARITPAHAGKSLFCPQLAAAKKDHPRPCGEKINGNGLADTQIGSPPPMRGKVLPRPHVVMQVRITPAHAGKSTFFLQKCVFS